MSYETIEQFPFRTVAGRILRLSDYDFIAKYIDKYPEEKTRSLIEILCFSFP